MCGKSRSLSGGGSSGRSASATGREPIHLGGERGEEEEDDEEEEEEDGAEEDDRGKSDRTSMMQQLRTERTEEDLGGQPQRTDPKEAMDNRLCRAEVLKKLCQLETV